MKRPICITEWDRFVEQFELIVKLNAENDNLKSRIAKLEKELKDVRKEARRLFGTTGEGELPP